jgi:hypothetical protein
MMINKYCDNDDGPMGKKASEIPDNGERGRKGSLNFHADLRFSPCKLFFFG